MSENMTDPGGQAAGDAELDAALAAADERMLAAISDRLDLDAGLAQLLSGRAGSSLHGHADAAKTGELAGAEAAQHLTERAAGHDAVATEHAGLTEYAADPSAAVAAAASWIETGSTVQATTEPGRRNAAEQYERRTADVAVLIRTLNASNEAVEDQYLRTRQAASTASRSARAAEESVIAAQKATVAHHTVLAEHPWRRAPLPRQVTLTLVTAALDGVACYFAAQALGGSQLATLVWTALFLAVLAGGQVALNFYRERNIRAWRALALGAGAIVIVLGILRCWFLAATGADGLSAAITGSCVFAGVTAGFLCLGYRALRAAETPQAWRARRAAQRAHQAARNARDTADRDAKERDRLIDAYLGHVRRLLLKTYLKTYPAEQQLAMESAVREHLREEGTRRPGSPG